MGERERIESVQDEVDFGKDCDYEESLEEWEGGPFPRKPFLAMVHFTFCF